ncbi:hypothetical protein ST47_g10040 [Ascochyta rabiei]|uniref:Uncharacterized protein n=1 Tax=Didymella rabiei TaxID=5454 RepID=A0A162W6C4_DIDRA|nr:hypothetical protein ST47_g10040 [Ascochyta rabiei]
MHETEPPGKITWYVTNPDPVPPDALPLCPIDYYTGRPEHRELHFGDEQPDMFPSEESYPTSAPFDAVEANSRVLNNRFYMESYGMIQLPKDLPSRDVAVDEEEEEYLRTLASAIPASVLHTKSTPEAAPTNLVDRSIQAHRPVATISDYYQATRAWKFEHEEGVANEALYPQKSALDYVQTQANSPAVTALDTDKGKYEAIVGSLVERRSSLEAIIGHFITENLERAVPTAAAILQHGVGSELAKHSHDKTTSNQRV